MCIDLIYIGLFAHFTDVKRKDHPEYLIFNNMKKGAALPCLPLDF